ncbi:MAG TPA: efflux RND transporter periplasmic adaptor subunit [Terriglobia bacterium]|nr:efflux RND transporter periplasmic adaptor subunit [Terriglobia bacterium]
MRDYRKAFIITLTISMLLAAGLLLAGWRYILHRSAPAKTAEPATVAASGSEGEAPAAAAIPLAPLQLTPQRLQSIGVTSAEIEVKALSNEIRAAGNVAVDERLQAYVQTRFSGWIQKVFANSTYQLVRKGQPLFTIYSPELVTTEQEYLLARKNRNLLEASTVPGVASGANSLLSSALERLKQWQVPEREIERLESTGQVRHDLEIDSPVSGYITEYNALPNLYVQPATRLYTVADLSTVWVFAEVFQSDMGQIRAGQPATVTSDAYPGRTFYGRVDFVYPDVNMNTRTVKVRLVLRNPGLKLTPGMFVNVSLKIPLGRRLAIPASGVFHTGMRNIVFVDHGGGYLTPHEVTLGPRAGDEYAVLKGLKPGERIVTSANFLIDSESQLQAALGSFVPPPPGAGAAAAMNQGNVAQTNVEFSTAPSPPSKGPLTVRVKLTGANGTPITGVQVKARFFMPAMPAMGMAAMQSVVELTDQGGGLYEGHGQLQSGGTWQVTVIAQKNGQTLATKQLSVNAEGGM